MPAKTTLTLLVNEEGLKKLRRFYDSSSLISENPYILFFAKEQGLSLSVYKKDPKALNYKAVFQGKNAESESKIWLKENGCKLQPEKSHGPSIEVKKPSSKAFFRFVDQIGSDEVGTGDFFGPVCVAAAYVSRAGLSRLTELGVTDSKKMDDEYILSIGPKLIKEFPYAQLALAPEKYNEVHQKGLNMNSIKAKMHNACLFRLKEKYPEARLFQDQFAESGLYYSYLKGEKDVARGIIFSTKGELAFPSVALASVIARYSFLRKMKALDEEYGTHFPLGSGSQVDEFAAEFVKQHGIEELTKIAKISFKNFDRLANGNPLL